MRLARRSGRRRRAAAVRISSGVVATRISLVLLVGDGWSGAEARASRRSGSPVDPRHRLTKGKGKRDKGEGKGKRAKGRKGERAHMSKVVLDRSETVRRIEQLGIVAVIRLRDPGKLRAV